MEILKSIARSLEEGDDASAARLTRQALAEGIAPKAILDDGLISGMNVVGEKFRVHDIFLPDVLLAAKAMYAGMEILKPLLASSGVSSRGRVVIGSVQGDLHDIGKNLVGIMLKGAGFEVIDLGNDVAAETFVATAEKPRGAGHRHVGAADHDHAGDEGGRRPAEEGEPRRPHQDHHRRRPGLRMTTPPRSAPTPTATIAPRRSKA